MFVEREIIYFEPFYFKNGNSSKNKYFVVINDKNNSNILAALPTRTDVIPANIPESQEGCIELSDANLTCYKVLNTTAITECGKCWDFSTHIYAYNIDIYEEAFLADLYPLEGVDYSKWGVMRKDKFNELIECLKNSNSIRSKFRKALNNPNN